MDRGAEAAKVAPGAALNEAMLLAGANDADELTAVEDAHLAALAEALDG